MTQKEALQVLAILKAAYPNSYRNMTEEEAVGTVNVWAMQFSTVPVDIVLMAIQKLISSSKFPPAISEVKDKLKSIHWEAYGILRDAVRSKDLTEPERAFYQRIHDATEEGAFALNGEPTLTQLAGGNKAIGLPQAK